MALITIKPSRGTVAFFSLLAIGGVALKLYNRHDAAVVQRDSPLAHSTRRLLRCVMGRDAERTMWPRPANDEIGPWENALNARLRLMVTEQYNERWPANCVSVAARVAHKMASGNLGSAAYGHAAETQRTLARMSVSRMAALEVVESGVLGRSLAALTLEVIKATSGTERGWDSPLPFEATDTFPVRNAAVAQGSTLPAGADYATFAAPEWVLYQDSAERRTHGLVFRGSERPTDTVLGLGAPQRVSPGASATLIESDEGPALLPFDTLRPTPVALPAGIAQGEISLTQWSTVVSGGLRWFAVVDSGRLRLWSAPLEGAQWTERLPASLSNAAAAGVLLASGASGVGVRAYVLRYGATGVSAEDWAIAVDPAAPTAAATVTRAQILSEWTATRARVRTCSAGDVAYALVISDESYKFVRMQNGAAQQSEVGAGQAGTLTGGRLEFSCNAAASLMFVDLQGSPGAMLYAPAGRTAVVLRAPGGGVASTRVEAAALVPNGVLAVVHSQGSVRAYRSYGSPSWSGGALLSMVHGDLEPGGRSFFDVHALSSVDSRVSLLATRGGARRSRWHAVRLVSEDGGDTWH